MTVPESAIPALSTSPALPFTRTEAYERVKAGKIAEVLDRIQPLQDAFERGQSSDLAVRAAMGVFRGYRRELTPMILPYADQHRSAYLAQCAAGLHLRARVSLLRTYRRGRDIPRENIKELEHIARQAWQYLDAAIPLTRCSSMAQAEAMTIDMVFGEDPWDRYLGGLKRSEDSDLLRDAALSSLRAEWGGKGSFKPMENFLNRVEQRALDQGRQNRLTALMLAYRGHHAQHFQDDPVRGDQLRQQSLDLHETADAHRGLISHRQTTRDCSIHWRAAQRLTSVQGSLKPGVPDPDGQAADLDRNRPLPEGNHDDASTTLFGIHMHGRGRSGWGLHLLLNSRKWGEPLASDLFSDRAHSYAFWKRAILRLGR